MSKIKHLVLTYDKIPYQWLNDLVDVVNKFDEEFQDRCNDAIKNLIDGAPENLDTLKELADAIQSNNTKLINNIKYYGDITTEITDEKYFRIDSNGIIIGADELSDMTDIVIPYKVGDTVVRGISDGLFQNNDKLVSVKFPEGIAIIGTNAFNGCTSLRDVNLPKSIILIGDNAFSNCTSLDELEIPNVKLTNQFTNSSVENIKFSSDINEVNSNAFSNSNIGFIELAKNIQKLSGEFTNCYIKEMSATDSLVDINNDIFSSLKGNMTLYCPENSTIDKFAKDNDNIKVVYSMRDTDLSRYVLKEDGKGLSTNDYTDEDKAKVDNLPTKSDLDATVEEKVTVITNDIKAKSIAQTTEEDYPLYIYGHINDENLLKCKIYGNSEGVGDVSDNGMYKITVILTGNNIIDINKCDIGDFDINGHYICSNGISYKVSCLKNGYQYTISGYIRSDVINDNPAYITFLYSDGTNGFNDGNEYISNNSDEYKLVSATSNKNKNVVGIYVGSPDGNRLYIRNGNFQMEIGNVLSEYKSYTDCKCNIYMNKQLMQGEYIDIINKIMYTSNEQTIPVTIDGRLKTFEGRYNIIYCDSVINPDKIESSFYQDINKLFNTLIIDGGTIVSLN